MENSPSSGSEKKPGNVDMKQPESVKQPSEPIAAAHTSSPFKLWSGKKPADDKKMADEAQRHEGDAAKGPDKKFTMPRVRVPFAWGKKKHDAASRDGYGHFKESFLSCKELMKISWKMFEERAVKFFTISVVIYALVLPVMALPVLAYALTRSWLIAVIIGVFSAVAVIAISLIGNIVYLEIAGDKDLGIRQAAKQSSPKIVPFVKMSLAYLAVAANIYLPLVLIFGVCFFLTASAGTVLPQISDAAGWALGLAMLVLFLLLIPVCLLLYALKNFASFALIVGNKPVLESVVHGYRLVKRNRKDVVWRVFVFMVMSLILMLPLSLLSEKYVVVAFLQQLVSLALGYWLFMSMYAMYKKLPAPIGAEPDVKDTKLIKTLIKTGSVALIIITIGYGVLISSMIGSLDLALDAGRNADAPAAQSEEYNPDDVDGDGLSNDMESLLGSDSGKADTDSDGLSDKSEFDAGSSPLKADSDDDGLNDYDEVVKWNSDPMKPDTDGDGYTDSSEVDNGYDPLGPGKLGGDPADEKPAEAEKPAEEAAAAPVTASEAAPVETAPARSFIYDICSGIGVYSADLDNKRWWKDSKTACVSPQCAGDTLVSDNSVDFSAYSARNECKALGGRLPSEGELRCIYQNRSKLGTFASEGYWTSGEFNDTYAWILNFGTGNTGGGTKDENYNVRCVKNK